MEINYWGNVNVKLIKNDLDEILEGKPILGRALGLYSKNFIEVNISTSDERFYSSGDVGEGFDETFFHGWVLNKPREQIQLAFPWGEEEIFRDYRTLDVKISRPSLQDYLSKNIRVLNQGGGYFCGIARGISSGHIIDRLNLYFSLTH